MLIKIFKTGRHHILGLRTEEFNRNFQNSRTVVPNIVRGGKRRPEALSL